MEQTEEFKLALQEAELLKEIPNSGIMARQFLLLVEENKLLKRELEEYQGYQSNARSNSGMSIEEYQDSIDYYMDDEGKYYE
jgi:hypothetical protein